MARIRNLFSLFLVMLAFLLLPGRPQAAQPASADPGAEVKRIEDMIRAARRTLQTIQAEGAGDPAASPELRSQMLALWQYGRQHPLQRAGAKATASVIQLLVAMRLDAEVLEKVESVKPEEPAWEWILDALLDQARRTGDHDYLIRKARSLLPATTDPARHGQLQLVLGLALERSGRLREAEEAFQKVIAERPGTRQAAMAAGHLHEVRHLNAGQNAPAFTATSTTGEKIALGDFKGKVVLLDVWASY